MNKSEVKRFIEKRKKELDLSLWDIELIFSKYEDDGSGAAATCTPDYVYQTARLVIYKCAYRKPNDLKHIITHELIHCLTQPLYVYCLDLLNGKLRTINDISDQREILTERIAKIIR